MRQIQLVGPVDKRPVAYPLFKLCDTLGKTLVITDDANFRRFSDDYVNEFTLGRSDFMIVNDISQELLNSLDMKLNSYDYVLFINTCDLLDKNDKTPKQVLFIGVDGKTFGYVWECEENKMFMPCKSAELGKICAHTFAAPLSVPAEEIGKILAKEVE